MTSILLHAPGHERPPPPFSPHTQTTVMHFYLPALLVFPQSPPPPLLRMSSFLTTSQKVSLPPKPHHFKRVQLKSRCFTSFQTHSTSISLLAAIPTPPLHAQHTIGCLLINCFPHTITLPCNTLPITPTI